ncbi:MAG TPA: hypothetical protein VJS44_12860 [Pyrinomonadaceae bacterium]|nr:hypothetical protein [Pyrinomonadaceae bacterium]
MLRPTTSPEERTALLLKKPTAYRTGLNRYRLLCNTCGEIYYVDADTFYMTMLAVQKGLDNPFCCDDCADGFNWNFAE